MSLDTLKTRLKRHLASTGAGFGVIETAIPGVLIGYAGGQKLPDYAIYRPAIGVVVQGAKQVWLGDQVLDYREGEALLVGASLLAKGVITRASAATPFIGLSIELDMALLREVAAVSNLPAVPNRSPSGLSVHRLDPGILECLARLVALLDEPDALPALYPALLRELSYWLLSGTTGTDLRAALLPSGPSQGIERVLTLLRREFAAPLHSRELSTEAGMSPSSFHRHFKAMTHTTPVNYQKQLRLVEARRLLDAGGGNVTQTAMAVGYESPAQFSRDYSRFFGVAPKRDSLQRRLQLTTGPS